MTEPKYNALNKQQNTINVFYDDEEAAADNLLVCRMVDRRKYIKPYSQQDQYQKFWPLKTSDTSGAGFELCTETKFESTTKPSAKFHGGLFS